MKVVVLSSHTPSLFWFRLDMMKAFLSKGYEVTAVGNEPEEAWKEKFAENRIKYVRAEISRNGTNPFGDLKTYSSLKAILREEKPDKIFAYQAKTVIYGGMAAKSLGISEFYPMIAGVGSIFLSDGLKAKAIRKVLVTEYKISMRHAKGVFFQNGDDVELFAEHGIVKKEKITMLHGSGVNLEHFTVQTLPEEPSFLFVGRLIRDKGIGEYLAAAKLVKETYPNARFMVVGPHDTNPSAISVTEFRTYVDDGVIEYFGEQSDVRPYLEKCRIFVLPSYREGTPKAVLEAMACGKAVITTDAPGCRETVTDRLNGYLVPPGNAEALAEKMIWCIENPEAVEKMAFMGRRIAEERFDVNKVNQTICDTMRI